MHLFLIQSNEKDHFGDIVKILRPNKRLGLIAAKNYGARHATGEVIIFLDAHVEANKGWLGIWCYINYNNN
jgi:polypeptide N-acetylgalactosaminyltransferase